MKVSISEYAVIDLEALPLSRGRSAPDRRAEAETSRLLTSVFLAICVQQPP